MMEPTDELVYFLMGACFGFLLSLICVALGLFDDDRRF